VLGLEFVLPDGTIINTGGKYVKNATGYNLTGILTGSEGTLAVITKIYLRLIPAPQEVLDILVPFQSIRDALELVSKLILGRIIPAAIEFMDEDAVKFVKKFLKEEMPFPDAGALLLIQIDGDSEDEIMNHLEKIKKYLNDDSVFVASAKNQRERLWKARRSIREAIEHESKVFLSEDTVVPRSEIPNFLTEVKKYFNSMGLVSAMFGHAGDGNVHIDVLKCDMDYDDWKKIVPEIKKNLYKIAVAHGGTLTGEHGIGVLRRDYLDIAVSKEQIELLKRIKAAFDPENVLNPGKIF
jgi:glycolate oxidase